MKPPADLAAGRGGVDRTLSRAGAGWLIVWLVLLTAGLRGWLAWHGGQYFYADEGRHDRGIALYLACRHGDLAGVRAALGHPEHALFPLVSAAVTAGQHLLTQFTAAAEWNRPEDVRGTVRLGAILLAGLSAVVPLLIYRLARREETPRTEACWAALLAGLSGALLQSTRHLLPYNVALALALLGLVVGWRARGAFRALLAGVLVGATHHVYNGYWYLVPLAAAGLVWSWRASPARWFRVAALGLGVAAGLGLPLWVGYGCGGQKFARELHWFSNSAVQGLFSEGWSLPWAYLWHAEGVWGAMVVVAVIAGVVRGRGRMPPRVVSWLGLLAGGYALLVLGSNGLERFVVYARSVLPLVAFAALAGGWALARLTEGSRGRAIVLVLVMVGAMAVRTGPEFSLVFPPEIVAQVRHDYGQPKFSLSVSGSYYLPTSAPVTRPDLLLVNAQVLFPLRGALEIPPGRVLRSWRHPLADPARQYDGHRPAERARLRTGSVAILLVALEHPDQVPDDLPAPLRCQPGEDPNGFDRR